MFVYRPWVMAALAIVAVVFPFAPIPFLDGSAGFALKLAVTGSIMKIMRDYRESMRSWPRRSSSMARETAHWPPPAAAFLRQRCSRR